MSDAADLYWQFAGKIYEPSLSKRDDGTICDLSNPLSVVMLVVDFETEVSMSGIINFIGNSAGKFGRETVAAIRAIGCPDHADLLARIVQAADDTGMTHAAIQTDRRGLEPFTVTSFAEIHGDKWNAATETIRKLESEFDYELLVQCAEAYVGRHVPEFKAALSV